ncbi:MAG: EamA family transporter, partial [Candidatus Saccharicenans sp.]
MNDHQKSLSYVHLAVFLFGFPGVIGKILAYSPLQLTWLRLILASLTLFIIIRWQKEKLFIFASRDLLWLIISGCLLAFHWSAFFWSIKLS